MTSYTDWFRATLVAREHALSEPDRLALWLELREAICTGRRLAFGAAIPPEQLPFVRRDILPELEARVESIGSQPSSSRETSGVLLWPVRTRVAEEQVRKRAASLARVKCWFEFSQVATHRIDELLAVGFAPGTDDLLVVCASGLELYDGTTRAKIASDDSDRPLPGYPDWADGIARAAAQRIALMGMDGGVPLPRRTEDGWSLGVSFSGDGAIVWLTPRYESVERPGSGSRRLARNLPELRAAGFSDTGRTLLLAEPSALHLFTRPAVQRPPPLPRSR